VGDLNKPLTTGTGNQSLDVSNNFVSSHRPNDAPKAMEKESGNHQQETTAKDNQEKVATTAKAVTNGQQQAEQFVSQSPQGAQVTAGTGTENQVFLTPHPQASAPLAGNAPMTDGATVRLPSGLAVPGEAVVDQMIAHFSVNKRLESGTVSLKLNPQELGELRMEIKVSQDNIKAHIIAQNPQAQEMIGLHLPRLREALEQQGLHLQQVEVTIAANDNTSREQYQGNTGRQQLNQSGHNSRPVFSLDTGEDSGESVHSSNKLSVLA
jgi:flagellar hook-length control protein FliK